MIKIWPVFLKDRKVTEKKGVALIFTVVILAALSIIGVGFAMNMQLERKAAANYTNSLKANYLAEAGLNRAIAELKDDAKANFVYNNITKNYSDTALHEGLGSYSVDVEDEQRKANINNANRELLRALLGDGDYTRADAIINYRNTNGPFETIEQIKLVAGIGNSDYEAIENDITIYSYLDPNTINNTGADEPRCPINVNTASDDVLNAVLLPLGATDADITTIIASRPFSNWKEFDDCIDALADIPNSTKNDIKNNCNPNRTKPVTRTTDFCFYSGGRYTLTSTGTVYDSSPQTNKLSEKRIKTIAYIYDMLNQTKKNQFQGADGDTTPVAFKVNTYDSCPVESIDSTNDWNVPNSGNYREVHDAIKNGFWDNMDDSFSDDNSMFYVDSHWRNAALANRLSYLWFCSDNITIVSEDSDGDDELVMWPTFEGWNQSPGVVLGTINPPTELVWNNFAWRATVSDGITPQMKKQRHDPGNTNWNYLTWNVMLLWTRYHVWPNDIESLLKQEFYDGPNVGTYETKINGVQWDSGKTAGAYQLISTYLNVHYGLSDHYFYVFQGSDVNFHEYRHGTETSASASGPLGFYAWSGEADTGERHWADNVRIIPEGGAYFESIPLPTADAEIASWGTISGTVTLSAGADKDSNGVYLDQVFFQTSADGGTTWLPADPGVLPGSSVASADSTSIQYKANFVSRDKPDNGGTAPYFSETIALEDVTITYLPRSKILYYASL